MKMIELKLLFCLSKKGAMYLIHYNDNDFIVYDNDEARNLAKKERELDDIELMYGFYEFVPVEQFEDGTFTLISGR